MLQTVVNQLSQQPHAVINLSLALLLVLSAWYLIGKDKIPCTVRHCEPLSQLEAEVKKQADLIVNLQSAALANSRAHNELVQHFQHLRAHVRRNNKSQQLLQDLSGVLEDLRAQLKASMVSHETMQSQSAALAELQHQMHTMAKLQQELMTQAQVIGSLKTQIGASAEQHRQLICQVDALGDIRAQLSDSLELQQQLQSRATSLEETQARVTQELKTQKALRLRQATLESAIAGASVRAALRGPAHAAPSGLMNRVFHRRTSGASAGSSISFLSEWFEHSFRASQGSAPDPALQLPKPSSSDLEATKLADSVNSINPMLWASKQDGLVSPFSLHQPPAGIFEDRGLIASSGPVHACSSPPMPHIPALRFQQKASRLRRCASTGMYEAVSAYAAADTMEEGSSLGRGSSGGSQGHVSRAVSSRGDFINNIYCDMERPVARFVSPFAFQPAGSLHHKDPTMPGLDEGSPPPAPRPPLIRPTTHKQMVHRLSREFQNVEPPSVPSMPAGGRAAEPSEEGVGNTQAVSFSLGSKAGPNLAQQGHVAKQAATSAWDQLLRCQSLEPPTASQLSVTRTQQAMTLIGRTESIRDRTSSK